MAHIVPYTSELKNEWDKFVSASKNATFLLYRDYMDYHATRFVDNSLLFIDDNDNIEALLPANLNKETLVSHGGLTYGGFIMSGRTSAHDPLRWMDMLKEYAIRHNIKSLIYKPIPHIYHRLPSEEDLYAIWRYGSKLLTRNLSSAVLLPDSIGSRLGKRASKRGTKYGITVASTNCVNDFWQIIVDDRRQRHNTVPVHSIDEMQSLADKFPNNILMFKALRNDKVIAGAIIYVNRPDGVIHLQYAAGNQEGMETHAVDIIYHHIVFNILPNAKYFDFGTSNEDSGRYLNIGMTSHKEEFGARSIVYDTYSIEL